MALSVFSTFNILVMVVISAAITFVEGIYLLLIYRTLARSSIESSAAAKKRSILAYSLILTIVLAVDLSLLLSNFKSDIAIAAVVAIVTRLLNYIFAGEFPLVLNMTHGGLTDIATHCFITFLYLLCSIIVQINLLRFFGGPMPDAKDQLTMMGMEPFDPFMCSSGYPNVIVQSTT